MAARQPQQLPAQLQSLLKRLRRRIRFYVWSEGIAVAVIVAAVAFWGFLAIDWLFEPSRPMRLAILAAAAAGVVTVFLRLVVRRAFVPLRETTLALLLERRFGAFHDSLLTTVDRTGHGGSDDAIGWAMIDRTRQAAVAAAQEVRPGRVLNWTPLRNRLLVAVALAGSIGLWLSLLAHETFGFCLQRMLLTSELWPRTTRLAIEGFPADANGRRREKVARDGDYRLVVKADAQLREPPPDDVEIRYRRADGSRGRAAMTRVGNAAVRGDAHQVYQYAFKSIAGDLSFDVLGGDARVDDLQLIVVERPQIVAMTLACRYPDYLQRSPRQLPISGVMPIPAGTQVTLHATASKPLSSVQIEDQRHGPLTAERAATIGPADRFQLALPPLDQDRTLLVTLHDQDEIASQSPYRIVLQAVPDTPPEVSIRLLGISTAITPNARIPVAGAVTDDYGLAGVFFDYQIDQRPSQRRDVAPSLNATTSYDLQQALDTQQFTEATRLAPQQRLRLLVKAADCCTLGDGPNIGSSQVFALDVVTPEHLRALLDRRELLLRQRFETLIGELVETRDMMSRLATDDASAAVRRNANGGGLGPLQPVPSLPVAGTVGRGAWPFASRTGAFPHRSTPPVAGRAPIRFVSGDARPVAAGAAVATPIDPVRRRLQTARIAQSIERTANETGEIAAAFAAIHAEMVNNRIATETLKQRLKEGIADPLRAIGQQKLPAIEAKIKTVPPHAAFDSADRQALHDAIVLTDDVLIEMQRILARMLELESFNEVLDLLRAIIQEQQRLNQETLKRRQEQLRGLLED